MKSICLSESAEELSGGAVLSSKSAEELSEGVVLSSESAEELSEGAVLSCVSQMSSQCVLFSVFFLLSSNFFRYINYSVLNPFRVSESPKSEGESSSESNVSCLFFFL